MNQPTTIALAIYELEAQLEQELRYRSINFKKYDRLYVFNLKNALLPGCIKSG